jgi:P-type Ca2+ transporter type 2C
MTARELRFADRRFTASGHGYSIEGRIRSTDGSPLPDTVERALVAMALCTDSELRDGEVIGDPTEGALLVLAEKGGIDTTALRQDRPRVREVPFDSDYKFMATFHRWTDSSDAEVVRCFVKGAPDVLAVRADRYLGGTDLLPFDEAARQRYTSDNAKLAEQGRRVLAVGAQDFADADVAAVDDPRTCSTVRARRARRHRRPAPPRSQAGHRRVPRCRHPRPDDHRRSRRHRRGNRR